MTASSRSSEQRKNDGLVDEPTKRSKKPGNHRMKVLHLLAAQGPAYVHMVVGITYQEAVRFCKAHGWRPS